MVLDLIGESYRRDDHRIWNTLRALDSVVGLEVDAIREASQASRKAEFPPEIAKLIEDRAAARRDKNFKRSDELRKELEQRGYDVRDTREGSSYCPPRELRKARPFGRATRIHSPATPDAVTLVAERRPTRAPAPTQHQRCQLRWIRSVSRLRPAPPVSTIVHTEEPPMAMTVRDVMTKEVTTLKRNESLTLADDLMHLGRIRHLPILDDDGETLIGIITQRDLFRGALAQAIGYGQYRAAQVAQFPRRQGSDDHRPDHDDARNARSQMRRAC